MVAHRPRSHRRRATTLSASVLALVLAVGACGDDDDDDDADPATTESALAATGTEAVQTDSAAPAATDTEAGQSDEPVREGADTEADGVVSREEAEQAALDAVGEGTVTWSGPEDDRGAAWEVEITRPDGSEVDVLIAPDGSVIN